MVGDNCFRVGRMSSVSLNIHRVSQIRRAGVTPSSSVPSPGRQFKRFRPHQNYPEEAPASSV